MSQTFTEAGTALPHNYQTMDRYSKNKKKSIKKYFELNAMKIEVFSSNFPTDFHRGFFSFLLLIVVNFMLHI